MKIIGKTATSLLLEASDTEVANICGYYGAYYMPNGGREIQPGMQINVNETFKMVHKLSEVAREVQATQASLRMAADALTAPVTFLAPIEDDVKQTLPDRK